MGADSKKSVLFVCMGNICRSPAAEGVFRAIAEREGVADRLEIDSAGMIGYHEGEPPDARMTAAARKRGYKLSGRARPFRDKDFERFDLIVPMDESNVADMRRLPGYKKHAEKVRLMLDFHPDPPTREVPDPYYGGPAGFDHVVDLVEAASLPLLRHLLPDAKSNDG